MFTRRLVITGVGAVTALGPTLAATADALARGDTAVRDAERLDGFACRVAAEVRNWDPRPLFRTPKALKIADRPARFAVAAARMALDAAGWADDDAECERLGVAIGCSGSDLQAQDIGRALAGEDEAAVGRVSVFADRILRGLNPLWLLVSLPNMTSAHVAIQTKARGPNTTIMSDWVAGHQAIGEAAEWIAAGEADAVLAGGADSAIQPFAQAAFELAGWLAHAGAEGFVPGEGAAVVMLEDRDAALARGRSPIAELRGYAVGTDLDAALDDVLQRSGWRRGDVSACRVAAPPIPALAIQACRAVRRAGANGASRACFEPRLGFPLAAAAPIDLALTLHDAPPALVLSAAIGPGGEAVALALELPGRSS